MCIRDRYNTTPFTLHDPYSFFHDFTFCTVAWLSLNYNQAFLTAVCSEITYVHPQRFVRKVWVCHASVALYCWAATREKAAFLKTGWRNYHSSYITWLQSLPNRTMAKQSLMHPSKCW